MHTARVGTYLRGPVGELVGEDAIATGATDPVSILETQLSPGELLGLAEVRTVWRLTDIRVKILPKDKRNICSVGHAVIYENRNIDYAVCTLTFWLPGGFEVRVKTISSHFKLRRRGNEHI